MLTRRTLIRRSARVAALLAAAGALPAAAQSRYDAALFEHRTLAELVKALGASAPAESREVTVSGPDLSENGAVVPIAIASTLPGVRRLLLLVEKNPNVLAALFEVGDAVDASFSTRVKMGQSSNVYAVAVLADGRVLFGQKEIRVTLGGCGA